jgi:flagellar biosynthesis protein FlhG
MLDDAAHVQDCRLLGIDPDAGMVEVARAFRNMKAVYAEGSLAIYGLIEDAGRQEKVEELEGAYGRITRRLSPPAVERPFSPAGGEKEYDSLSPGESTGRFLRNLREAAGLSLKEVAHRTKISSTRLDQIEQEKFDLLPAPVYLRGFVFAYARTVGFAEPKEAAGVYLERYQQWAENVSS